MVERRTSKHLRKPLASHLKTPMHIPRHISKATTLHTSRHSSSNSRVISKADMAAMRTSSSMGMVRVAAMGGTRWALNVLAASGPSEKW